MWSLDLLGLRERLETRDIRLLDVRTLAEYQTAHIPGPLTQLRDELTRHLDDEVVLICRSGARGRQTWELERQVRLVAGGLVATSVAGSTLAPRMKWLAGAVGTGLVVAALTNPCAMGTALTRLPWNRRPRRRRTRDRQSGRRMVKQQSRQQP